MNQVGPRRLMVRTSDFHSDNESSILSGGTNKRLQMVLKPFSFSYFFCFRARIKRLSAVPAADPKSAKPP